MDNKKSEILMKMVSGNKPVEEIKKFILTNMEDINFAYITDFNRHNYLTKAQTPEVAQLLIDAGVDVNAVDDVGDSVMDHHTHQPEIYNLLQEHGAVHLRAGKLVRPAPDRYVLDSENTWGTNMDDIKIGLKSVDAITICGACTCSALLTAADDGGHDQDVKFLLNAGANLSYFQELKELYEEKGSAEMVDFLEKAHKKWCKERKAKIRKTDKEKRIGNITKNKRNILKLRKLRKITKARDGKLSGSVIADKIAEDVISGKEKRTITPEIGAELKRRIISDQLQKK